MRMQKWVKNVFPTDKITNPILEGNTCCQAEGREKEESREQMIAKNMVRTVTPMKETMIKIFNKNEQEIIAFHL